MLNDCVNMSVCLPAQTPTVAFTTGIGSSGGVIPTHASSECGPEALFQCHQNTDAEAKPFWITFFKSTTLVTFFQRCCRLLWSLNYLKSSLNFHLNHIEHVSVSIYNNEMD